ncbi:MAG: peptidylprolyl isomerase [Ignavibacteriaceae bacterium]
MIQFYKIQDTHLIKLRWMIIVVILYLSNPSLYAAIINEDTLAVIENKVITSDDFIASYKEKLTRIGLTDNGETRFGYLMNLVTDELLITEAKNKGFDKTEIAKKEYKRICLQELLNAYTIKYISPTININENELQDLFVRLNTKIKVCHLYAPTKGEADLLYKELLGGKKFEELAKEKFLDAELRKNGGSLGYISVDEMDPEFEKTAYSMRVGETSEPVKTVYGYSIIRVDAIKINPLITENEFLKAKEKLKAFARKRAFEEASKEFSKLLNQQLEVRLNDELIDKIYNSIQENPFPNLLETSSSISKKDLTNIVVYSKLGKWDLQTLINEMSTATKKQEKQLRTKENVEDFIRGLVNRKFIEQKAIEEHLDKTPAYIKNVEFNFNTYLLSAFEDEMKKKISVSPDSVKEYYLKNINQFKTEPLIRLSSILLDNSTLADSIKNLLESGILFEELAKKYSTQTFVAENGGDLGYFKKDELDDFAEKVFELKIGQWSGPYSDTNKYVFLKCTDLKPSLTKSFEESKEEIKKNLSSLEWYKIRDEVVISLNEEIECKVFLKKLYEIKI